MRDSTYDELFHRVVDRLLDDGFSVMAPPLMLRPPDDSTFEHVLSWLATASDGDRDLFMEGSSEPVRTGTGIAANVLDQHWPASELLILVDVLEELDVSDDQVADHPAVEALTDWLDSFADGHPFDRARLDWQLPPLKDVRNDELVELVEPTIRGRAWAAIRDRPPVNAWLLVCDENAAVPAATLRAMTTSDDTRIRWTAPRQIQPGDLVAVYVMAPVKEVRFVGRAASFAEFRDDISVNSATVVDAHQWWVELASVIELVRPIPFSRLREASDGHLILRGKPTHYLKPRAVSDLAAAAGISLPRPVGDPSLPDPATMTFEQWRDMSTGPLSKESQIEDHVVRPLLRIVLADHPEISVVPQYRSDVGVPDYALLCDGAVIAVVEVKLGARAGPGPVSRTSSPDLRQCVRYADHFGVPGVLVDANRVLLFPKDEKETVVGFERATATPSDITRLGRHLTMNKPHANAL